VHVTEANSLRGRNFSHVIEREILRHATIAEACNNSGHLCKQSRRLALRRSSGLWKRMLAEEWGEMQED